ncbi:MAG: hypothetical protein LQ337_008797 [Flavoplaca oasis]|nr:MAG: hypothetical protein LQ337_008797 [Flavoplaca oasis]
MTTISSLATLPPELLYRIFELLPDFSTLTALTLTSRLFRSIWLTHSHRIAPNITPQVISHLTEAENLATAQEKDEALVQHPSLSQQQQRHLQIISRLRRLVHNAHLASLMCDSFARACAAKYDPWCRFTWLSPDDSRRPELQRIFYRLWLLVLMSWPRRRNSLKNCALHGLCQLRELMQFIRCYRNDDDLEEPRTFRDVYDAGLDFREDMWVEVCDEVFSSGGNLCVDMWFRKQ